MTQIFKQILENSKNRLAEQERKLINRKIVFHLSPEQFKELFLIKAKTQIMKRGIASEFKFTPENTELINQLFYYFTNNANFKGNQNKGFLICGKNGIGKSLIFKVFSEIILDLNIKNITEIHAKILAYDIKRNGLEAYTKKPFFVDDMGKENKDVTDFGTKIQPIVDFIALRYDTGAMTFGTTNYNLESLQEMYGLTTTDRMKEMFNIITLKGESFRR